MIEARMGAAVAETVARLDTRPEDAALVRLVEQYAAVVDDAALVAAELAETVADDADTASALAALRKRVEAHAVLADVGPKLLAALAELGASPKARAALARGKGVGGDSAAGKSKLDELRARRVRADRAAVVDAPAS